MKRITAIMLVTAAAAVACSKEDIENHGNEVKTADYVEVSFSAAMENGNGSASDAGNAGTKTVVDGTTGDVSWSAGDCISVFDNSATATEHNNKFTFSGESSFSGKVPEDATEFYALYPYDADAAFEQGKITTTLPAEQTAVAGTFADGTAVMAGKISSKSIAFKNICSHICFTVADDITDVKSITLMGNASEALCGTFTISWNEDEPQIALTEPETYVTLRNADGSALTPGTYWFTVLPVEFSKGFTVTLSKTDGSQKAWSWSSAVSSVGRRNRIQPIQTISSAAYEDNLNYFIRYNDGFDITAGGYTFNKTTKAGGALVNDTKGNCNINTDGVYFIDPSATTANFSAAKAYKSLIVMGADNGQRSEFNFYRQARPYEGGEILLMSNLRCTVGSKNAFAQNTGETGNSFATFGDIILSNCHFKNIGKNFMQFNQGVFTKVNINVEDCELGISGETVYIINTGSNASEAQSIVLKNNIFYAESENAATKFKLIHSDKLVINAFNGDTNTFDRTIPEDNILRIGDITTSFDFARNLFSECSKAGTTKLIAFRVNTNAPSATGTVTNNYYYNSTDGAVIGPGIRNSVYKSMTINSIAVLTASPLSANWNPAEETYGAYTYPSNVSKTVGAKRADMTSTSTASVNSAAYADRQEVNLGSF